MNYVVLAKNHNRVVLASNLLNRCFYCVLAQEAPQILQIFV